MWTLFWDMHSGGSAKVVIDGKKKEKIYIELPEEEAINYFEQRFDRNPYNVTCDCCGEDYSIYSEESIEYLSDFHRDYWTLDGVKKKLTVEEYAQRDDVMIIYAKDIAKGIALAIYPSLESKQ